MRGKVDKMRINSNYININPIVINESYKADILKASIIQPAKRINPVLDRQYDVTLGNARYSGIVRNVVGSVGIMLAVIIVLFLM